jgi:bifunctional non-homologous end joining protein LigD
LSFVVQKHDATRLHYDFRLELDGVLLSWAVPKGPSYDPADKRMAVQTEDHPLAYASFEGTIPEGHYGAGEVIVWDRGTWEPMDDPHEGLERGKLAFRLHGEKLEGAWELVRMRGGAGPRRSAKPAWLLIKRRDEHARPQAEYDVVTARPDSVLQAPPPGREAALPESLEPQLATLATGLPDDGPWIFEIKFDGYRMLVRFGARGHPVLYTRQGNDWSSKLPVLQRELARLDWRSSWLDGELVALGPDGVPDFNALQNAFDRHSTRQLTFYAFDLPFHQGRDLRDEPLTVRRALLQRVLQGHESEHLRFSVDAGADADSVLEAACRLRLEGVIAKRADSPYRSGRGTAWLKLKCQQRQEFVIGGFTDREAHPGEVGSLLLGVHDAEGRLVPVGRVGTGWGAEQGRQLYRRLGALHRDSSPFHHPSGGAAVRWRRGPAAQAHWVRPELLAEVAFGGWTPAGQIRHASFIGLRSDKEARMITRDVPLKPAATPSTRGDARRLRITHPERVIDPSTGLTKLDLVRYYESVAERILPHLKGRAVAEVRGPQVIGKSLFFQRNDPAGETDDTPLQVRNAEQLLAAAQLNVIEFHTGNCQLRTPDKPDRIVFDLDPGERLAWPLMQEGAQLLRGLLQELELQSWLKTSGGKGLHVVVPIAARWPAETVRALSKAVVEHLARTLPDRFVAKSGAANRVGRIFVDYLRNNTIATTVAAFSARARPGLGVSMPVSWDDLPEIESGAHWTVQTARDHLSFEKTDPWSGYFQAKQSIATGLRTLGVKLARAGKAD